MYQVYLRSFADGNGDGVGDIAGLRSRLDYIKWLGADAIWVNPWYESPLHDGGYDVSDYRSINPLFGTLEQAHELILEAEDRGMRVLVDLVPNHTSSEHEWFREALAAPPDSPERARYHFRRGRGDNGDEPPNDWQSVFGGPAWTRVDDGEWYLHLFDVTQPDLNWSNPDVRSEFEDIIRFWLDFGAGGFRVDVAHGKSKHPGYLDMGVIDQIDVGDTHPVWDRPELHEIVRQWRQVLDDYPGSMMVAEAWVANWERLVRYLRPGEYDQVFDFLYLQAPWDAAAMRLRIDEAIRTTATVGAAPTWVLSNHDVVRHATRYALPDDVDAKQWLLDGDRNLFDPEMGRRRARAASLLTLALPGSVYLYQGEELGLHEVFDLPLDVLDDPTWKRSGYTNKGRDGCRVPIPWGRSGHSFGFGSDGSWLPQPADWGSLSVEAQRKHPESTLRLYREAIALRAQLLKGDGGFRWLDAAADVLSFHRGPITCSMNLGREERPLPGGEVILTSGPVPVGGRALLPETSAWVMTDS